MKMRILFIYLIASLFVINVFGQQQRVELSPQLKNYSVQSSYKVEKDVFPNVEDYVHSSVAVQSKSFSEATLGSTEYDSQSNKSIDTRIYLYDDNSIGAAWIMGSGPSFTDRGTGYNFFDGTSWGAQPTERVEDIRTGWGSYYPFNDGEIIVAHTVADLYMSTRATKGTGTWTHTSIPNPAGAELTWPRVVTVGDTIHLLSASYVEYEGMTTPIIYSRSVDAGSNWTHEILPGMTLADGNPGFSADIYAWATPKDGQLAFIVGNSWHDIFIMKSSDGGDNWAKTTVFSHPNPYTFETLVPLDTTYVTDGLLSIEFDSDGLLHAAFGVVRVMVDDPASEMFSSFPFAGYLAYWNESMGMLTDMEINAMDQQGRVIGWLMDLDQDQQLFPNFTDFEEIKSYANHGMVSQPQLTIDEDDNIFVTFAHVNETNYSGEAYYRHIWARKSIDGGTTWSDFSELTGGFIHEYDECVFGAMAKKTDDYVHMIYQMDDIPGAFITEEHIVNNSSIVYLRVLKTDIGTTGANIFEYNNVNSFSIYPNPASDFTTINISSSTKIDGVVTVMNLVGQNVYTNKVNVNPGNNMINISLSQIPSGIYIVNVEAGQYKESKKLIVE